MCTSFINRDNDIFIGMNFDNSGMKYSINNNYSGWFIVSVDGGRGKYPSFGVNKNGQFVNNLLVNSNGKGLYKRPSTKVTHTTKLISDIINGKILCSNLSEYLKEIEVVNTPDWSCHNMIIDDLSNVWIVEPGRGNIYSDRNQSTFFVMTNTSILDMINKNAYQPCDRYEIASSMLREIKKMTVASAFQILQATSQDSGEWTTALSMVFSKNENKVYYCHNSDFEDIYEYKFE